MGTVSAADLQGRRPLGQTQLFIVSTATDGRRLWWTATMSDVTGARLPRSSAEIYLQSFVGWSRWVSGGWVRLVMNGRRRPSASSVSRSPPSASLGGDAPDCTQEAAPPSVTSIHLKVIAYWRRRGTATTEIDAFWRTRETCRDDEAGRVPWLTSLECTDRRALTTRTVLFAEDARWRQSGRLLSLSLRPRPLRDGRTDHRSV